MGLGRFAFRNRPISVTGLSLDDPKIRQPFSARTQVHFFEAAELNQVGCGIGILGTHSGHGIAEVPNKTRLGGKPRENVGACGGRRFADLQKSQLDVAELDSVPGLQTSFGSCLNRTAVDIRAVR